MAEVALNVHKREGRGKGYANRLYVKGYMPAVFYGKSIGSIPIELAVRDLENVLRSKAGRNAIIDLHLKEGEKDTHYNVMLKDVVYHPIKRDVLHADFLQISMSDKIQVTIPVNLEGEAPGAAEGGTLEHALWEVDIKCLPGNIPSNLTVDISGLNIGDSLTVADIRVPAGIEILADADTVVARVIAAQGAEEPAEKEEEPKTVEDTGAEETNA